MLKKNPEGKLVFYIAKKDLEEVAESVEFDSSDKWGGEVLLSDGSKYYFEPMDEQPDFPVTLRAIRLDSGD
ncbi:putative nitrogen fixation protein NifT [Candidatus Methylobacter favarea]|nr:putative nitrogen fixation protein NifT [Candidatus Methylobacter favarea]